MQPPPVKPPVTSYVLTLRPLPDEVPAAIRLRRVLKGLLRHYRFRCVRCVEEKAF